MEDRSTDPAPHRRPVGVLLVTVGLLAIAVGSGGLAATALRRGDVPWAGVPVLGETGTILQLSPVPTNVVAGAAVLVGLLALVVAVGWFLLRPWGWTGLMLLAAVLLTINLVAVVIGHPNDVSMAVAIVAVLYANQRRIQLLFRGVAATAFPTRAADVRTPN